MANHKQQNLKKGGEKINRRAALAAIGATGVSLVVDPTEALPQEIKQQSEADSSFATIAEMKQNSQLTEGMMVSTQGYFIPADGGGAFYRIAQSEGNKPANGGDVIALENGLYALLKQSIAVNYKIFGAKGDAQNDDAVQIKRAHTYANKRGIPVINLSGEYWLKEPNGIPISTNVQWGNTIFHIDEQYNSKTTPRFVVKGLEAERKVNLDEETKAAFLEKLKPGVQVIRELAFYKNCLISIIDEGDHIGFRAGESYQGQFWPREELFYVAEGGRILGDIAWKFNDYTSLKAYPCSDTYLAIEGGGFQLSGDNPGMEYSGFYHYGMTVRRSRTVIRNQWVGLERGHADISMEPRMGFYNFSHVYDLTLENIRLNPWEKNRRDLSKELGAGTYGISGSRMMDCTFRNVTSEGSRVHWGVMGTNINKNLRIEHCRLNRIDIHFHCWNLTIRDSEIGLRGITVTGGGRLLVDNTTVHRNRFINFRYDYGATWDGHIRIHNSKLVPPNSGEVSVLDFNPPDFDYGYPIVFGRSIEVTDLVIDYNAVSDSQDICWLMNVASFSETEEGSRLIFPSRVRFRNVQIEGRTKGARLVYIPQPYSYKMRKEGSYDGTRLQSNCRMSFENIPLEKLSGKKIRQKKNAHLQIGESGRRAYRDDAALYPEIRLMACHGASVYLGGSAADITFENCTINRITTGENEALRGRLAFNNCHFQPHVHEDERAEEDPFYALSAELGTYFTNCTIHVPRLNGAAKPELIDRIQFVQINNVVRHFHLNTTLGNELLAYLEDQDVTLKSSFIAMLKSHHELEPSIVNKEY